MSNATYLVTKNGQICKIIGETKRKMDRFKNDIEEHIVYFCKRVRSARVEAIFEEIDSESIEVVESEVHTIDTNYAVLRNAVDKAIGID